MKVRHPLFPYTFACPSFQPVMQHLIYREDENIKVHALQYIAFCICDIEIQHYCLLSTSLIQYLRLNSVLC